MYSAGNDKTHLLSGLSDFVHEHYTHVTMALILLAAVNELTSKPRPWLRRAMSAAAVLFSLVGLAWMTATHFYYGNEAYPTLFILAITVAMALPISKATLKSGFIPGFLLLLIAPVIPSVGTYNDLMGFMSSNFGAVVYRHRIWCFHHVAPIERTVSGISVAVSIVHFLSISLRQCLYFERYESGQLNLQTYSTSELAPLSGIQLDKDTIDFISKSAAILKRNGFKPGDQLLSLYDLPGLVYALQGVSPGIPWYISWPQDDHMNAHYLLTSNLSPAQKLYLIVVVPEGPSIGTEARNALETKGFSFPRDFSKIGSMRLNNHKVLYFVSKERPAIEPWLLNQIMFRH